MSWFINGGSFFKKYSNTECKRTIFRYLLMGINKNEVLKELNNSVTYDTGVL